MIPKRGADFLVEAFEKQGITTVFTLSGNHIMPIFDALIGRDIQLIHTRHEASTVHMADCWARLKHEVGIAMVTGGPGHANAVSALYTALMAESPVVLLSGHAPNTQIGRGAFQEMRQAEMCAPVCKASWTCAGPEFLAADFKLACAIALSGRPGPVHLSLPSDALEDSSQKTQSTIASPDAPSLNVLKVKEPSAAVCESITAALQSAKRPLILCGPSGAHTFSAELALLENALHIPTIAMESPRGLADPSLGSFSEVIEQADVILLLNKRSDFTMKFLSAPPFAKNVSFIQLDSDLDEIERTKIAAQNRLPLSVQADLLPSINGLLQAVSEKKSTSHNESAWYDFVKSAVRYRPAEWATLKSLQDNVVHPVNALLPLQVILDSHPDSVLVSDGGEIGQWAQACLHAPNRILNGVAGSIGSSLPFAIAAALAKKDVPVVAVLGDGTFGFHSSEIDTAVRYQAPFLAVIGNDACWNAEYQIQVREYGTARALGCELLPSTRYDQVCMAFGGVGELVNTHDQVLPAALRLHHAKLPACLNILIEGAPAPNLKRPS
ncbi:thiamine pyrophosphate-binding protein [Polynucleobacter antarcticus]|uniref:Acetolactate synthase n=1 Tax=Polynucleobacter antarcticus TaxID=1743162 RepID=A0A6M9PQS5_9BURK|nr:thiamine pyrophosphate-binding protein [Polynucleobacter antarcticus]QKM62232.1 acetolactate synthase [Polynucleobacter antarcticus]